MLIQNGKPSSARLPPQSEMWRHVLPLTHPLLLDEFVWTKLSNVLFSLGSNLQIQLIVLMPVVLMHPFNVVCCKVVRFHHRQLRQPLVRIFSASAGVLSNVFCGHVFRGRCLRL